MDKSLLAPCGMNCAVCIGHLRDKKKCSGCRATDGSQPKHCQNCNYARCPELTSGGLTYCFQCPKFPCPRLKVFDRRYQKWSLSLIQNLRDIEALSEETFLQNEAEKWACPVCGNVLSAHEDACLGCGYQWRNKQQEGETV